MVIYIDLEIFLNFCYDLLLMMCTDVVLKRYAKIYRHIISALFGAFSILILFLPISEYMLFFLKIITSFIMIIISFGYKNIKYFSMNIMYLYMESFILGGFLYLLNNEFLNHKGLVFFNDGISINYLVLLLIAPFILIIYIYTHKKYNKIIKYNYKVLIYFKDGKYLECNGILDTANSLKDPVTKKYIILINKRILMPFINIRSPMYVPYKALNSSGLVKCFSIKNIVINNQIFNNYLVGIADNNFGINGSDCLLNNHLLEEICFKE